MAASGRSDGGWTKPRVEFGITYKPQPPKYKPIAMQRGGGRATPAQIAANKPSKPPLLTQASERERIKQLQRDLNTKLPPGQKLVVDGIMGPKTRAAMGYVPNSGGGASGGNGGGAPAGGGGGGFNPGVSAPSVMSSSSTPPAPGAPPVRPPQTSTADLLKQFSGKAAQQTAAELDPQINALSRAMELLRVQTERQRQETTQRKGIAQGDLTAIFDRLTNYMGNVQNTQDKQYGRGGVDVSNLYNSLRSSVSGQFDRAERQTNNEAARLGLEEATPATTAAMNSDEAFLRGMANNNQANSLNTLAAMRQGFDSLMSFQRGNAQQEKTTQIGQSNRDYDRQLNELTNKFNDQNYDLLGQRTDIEGGRGAKTQAILDALIDKQKAEESARAQQELERYLALEGLGLDKAQFQYGQERDWEQTQIELAKLAQQGQEPGKEPKYVGGPGAFSYVQAAGNSPKVVKLLNDFARSPYNDGTVQATFDPEGNRHIQGRNFMEEVNHRALTDGLSPAEVALFLDAVKIMLGESR